MELKSERQRALDSRTLLGHARNGLGYGMSVYCVYRVFASLRALAFGEDFSSDPVSRFGGGGWGRVKGVAGRPGPRPGSRVSPARWPARARAHARRLLSSLHAPSPLSAARCASRCAGWRMGA
jgi:hypothetical protein